MANLAGIGVIGEDLYSESVYPLHRVGQLGFDSFGNRYRYVKAGASALVVGNLLQEPAEDTAFVSMTPSADAAIGATQISVTLGGTAVTANMFDGGLLTVSVTPGLGQRFQIVAHTVQTATTGACIFTLDRPLKVAITAAASKISVRKNPYLGVIQSPVTTQTGAPVGVAIYAVTGTYYGWIQSGGEASVLFDTGTNTASGALGVGASLAVAGSVKAQTGAEGGDILGFSRQVASVDSTTSVVHLMIDWYCLFTEGVFIPSDEQIMLTLDESIPQRSGYQEWKDFMKKMKEPVEVLPHFYKGYDMKWLKFEASEKHPHKALVLEYEKLYGEVK
jgi:hypothetical protein